MSKVLVISKGDYADEFDVEGFDIVSEECWTWKQLEWKNTKFPQEIYFGTNEAVVFETLKEYLNSFKTHKISDEEEKFLRDKFGNYSFGIFPWIEGDASEGFYEKHGHCPE